MGRLVWMHLLLLMSGLGWSSSALSGAIASEVASSQAEGRELQTAVGEASAIAAYPHLVARLVSDCVVPQHLAINPYRLPSGQERQAFYCWNVAGAEAPRTGQWLGTVPTTVEPEFGTAIACPPDDAACADLLGRLQTDYSAALSQAELTCAAKQGTLFLQPLDRQVDVRCAFFATTVYDTDGDGQIDYEDPISVDISLLVADLPLAAR